MARLNINGQLYDVTENTKLMPYLRDVLRLTSVKDGCSQGGCGTCTVIIDKKATKACIPNIEKLDGKEIITCEGLSEREKEVWAYCFAKCGAVQCGFCIPGMVMSGKALLDQNPDPTREEVRQAIKNNICRCTGYKKIIDGILLAAKYFREDIKPDEGETNGKLGNSILRVDAFEKTLGTAKYPDDYYFDGMLYGSAVRSEYPRAKILSIDTSEAEKIPGVVCVLTADDIPGKQKIGHLVKDYDVMIPLGKTTHFLGDAVALVAAETKEALKLGLKAVKVHYKELEGIFSPFEAMKKDAPKIHESGNLLVEEHLVRGHADEVIKNSKYVVTNHYSVPFTEHAFMEPECAIAIRDNDCINIISADQGIYQTQNECAEALGIDPGRVRVTAAYVGGGFGGKEDMSVQHHAALLSWFTNRPVKVKLTRDESLLIHPKRHAMEMDFTTACDEDGMLTAMKAVIVADTGAYASLGGPVLQRACTHAAGPYNYHVIDILGQAWYTNNPPAGAFRGFGVTQSCFATEMNLNQLAEMAGISPFEIRYKNAVKPGDVLPNGQICDNSTAFVETLRAVKKIYKENPNCGIACAMKNSGVGVGVPDTGRSMIVIKDGKAYLHASAACIGQGMGTVQVQMLVEKTGLPLDKIVYCKPDTLDSPDCENTTASRQTVFTGEAVCRAAKKLKEDLDKGYTLDDLNGKAYIGKYTATTDKIGSLKENPISHVAYGYATQLVILNDDGTVKKMVCAHDVGQAVNPVALEGQIEGGSIMGLGYAVSEDFPVENGKPKYKLGMLGLFKADKTPEVESIIVSKPDPKLACGAKGVGEITAIPGAPAAALAYYNRNGIFQTKLPLEGTPYSRKKPIKK